MIRLAVPALLLSVLSGCSSNVCDYIGAYSGSFTGDADGNVTIEITDGGDNTLVHLTLDGDTSAGESLAALGDGTVNCDDGVLDLTLTDADGAEIGDFSGSMDDKAGDWSLVTGEAGTWSLADAAAE